MDILKPWMQVFVPPACFDKFFVDFDFFDGPCIKLTISKLLGFVIILGSVLVKVPQIIKLSAAKSSEGISIVSVSLELGAVTSTVAYGYLHKFPFSSWGDSLFLVFQTWIIAVLVLHYAGQTSTSIMYSAVYAVILAFVVSPAIPERLVWLMYASNMPNIALARIVQIYTNFRNGSTGQLSAITICLLFAGAAARIFTSIQETGDLLMILQFVTSTVCNGILTFQIFYYWTSDKVKKE